MAYGTLQTLDTLATLNNTTVAEYGEAEAFSSINAALAAHNALLADAVGDLATYTSDNLRTYGGVDEMQIDEVDEHGQPDAQKIAAGVTVGFPLRNYAGSLQWTRHYFMTATVAELAAQVNAMMAADARLVRREMMRALYRATSYTFLDRFTNRISFTVYPLVNADGLAIPIAPDGTTFDAATHTHLLGTASFSASNLSALILTVIEHYSVGMPKVYINRAQEATVRGFTGFQPYLHANVIAGDGVTRGAGNLDTMNINNRAIGVYDGAEIWVKPWMPANYALAFVDGPAKPLVIRTRTGAAGALELVYEDERHPLRARTYQREFGVGVWNRTAAAILRTDNATYASPTFN